MAGLACALDLRAAGADVVVLEATSRPGGRVRTVTFPDGRWVEAGGEWVDTSHEHVHSLLDRYGLRAIGDGAPWWARESGWVEDERGLRPAVDAWAADDEVAAELAWFDELIDAVAAQIADPADPAAHPDAAAIDARSIADLFDQARLGPKARFLLDREMAFEYTCAPEEASVLFIAQQRAVMREEEARVPAGAIPAGGRWLVQARRRHGGRVGGPRSVRRARGSARTGRTAGGRHDDRGVGRRPPTRWWRVRSYRCVTSRCSPRSRARSLEGSPSSGWGRW